MIRHQIIFPKLRMGEKWFTLGSVVLVTWL